MVDGGVGVLDCTGEEVESVDNAVAFADCGFGEVLVQELNGVGEQECFGGAIDDAEAAVIFECRSNIEPYAAAEVPCFLDAWLGVDEYRVSNRAYWGGTKVEWAVEVFSCGHFRGES